MLFTRLLFVEAGNPVPWTKPEGIPDDPTQPVRLQALFRDGFRANADGGNRFLDHDADAEFVHAEIIRNGGEELRAGR